MAINQTIIPMDAIFKAAHGYKIILNLLNSLSLKDQETLSKNIMTVYDNVEAISTVPSCECGATKRRFKLRNICPECGTAVTEISDKVDPILWLENLDRNLKFLNPCFWNIMKEAIKTSNTDWLRWLCDSSYNPQDDIPPHVEGIYIDILNSKRNYSHTMSKLRDIIIYITNLPRPKEKIGSQGKYELVKLLEIYDECVATNTLFSTYLPIVNKKLFVMEETTKGKFINLVVSDVMDVVLTWVKASNSFDIERNFKKANNVTAGAISELSKFFIDFTDKYILKKSGLFRKHVYGSRGHFTFRSVVTSIAGPHQHDEVHIPWAIGVTVLRPMILNKLARRGYNYKNMMQTMAKCIKMYDPVIDDIMKELLRESRYGKLPIILQRNPTLSQSSALLTYITKIKTCPQEKTISLSSLIVKLPNGIR